MYSPKLFRFQTHRVLTLRSTTFATRTVRLPSLRMSTCCCSSRYEPEKGTEKTGIRSIKNDRNTQKDQPELAVLLLQPTSGHTIQYRNKYFLVQGELYPMRRGLEKLQDKLYGNGEEDQASSRLAKGQTVDSDSSDRS